MIAPLAGLEPGDRLAPGLGARLVQDGDALFLELLCCELYAVSVRDVELDALTCGTGRSAGHSGIPLTQIVLDGTVRTTPRAPTQARHPRQTPFNPGLLSGP